MKLHQIFRASARNRFPLSSNLHRSLTIGRGPNNFRLALRAALPNSKEDLPLQHAESEPYEFRSARQALLPRSGQRPHFLSQSRGTSRSGIDIPVTITDRLPLCTKHGAELLQQARDRETEDIVTRLRNSFFFDLLTSLEESR